MTVRSRSKNLFSDPVLRRFAVVGAAGLVGCLIARAPTILGKVSVPGLGAELSVNAGYVLVFGPLILLAGVIWAGYHVRQSAQRLRSSSDRLLAMTLFALPFLAAAFISVQFFLLLAPKGECLSFDRVRYLIDLDLQAFQPEYCMGMSDEVRRAQPWLLQPPIIQGWLQVFLPVITLAITLSAWRRWSR